MTMKRGPVSPSHPERPGQATIPPRTRLSSGGPDTRIRLLVADDDPRVLAAIRATIALAADIFMVAAAADAATALACAKRTDPRVALVDVLIPDAVTGLELVASLAREPACGVVAMSVRSGFRQAALAAGAVAFVEKSGDIDAILDAVRSAAAGRT
jgi:DNA-binding NarL/FixJ family response regulator